MDQATGSIDACDGKRIGGSTYFGVDMKNWGVLSS